MRDGNRYQDKTLNLYHLVFSLPMRDGNQKQLDEYEHGLRFLVFL